MCNCIIELEGKLEDRFPEMKRKKVESISFPIMLDLKSGMNKYVTPFIVELENQRKTEELNVPINNCPFCGEKIEYK